ncbi:MAG: trehalose/maltose transport system permease protein [Solirubrobacteraceae bacterium]|jgi:multiple sugar transport system permease protein|nr:trehalose/maltose transport system permease protein [Solirubrobacteraceae bacterium]
MSAVSAPSSVAAEPKAKKPRLSERSRAERKLGWMLVAPAVIVMIAVTVYPIINAFVLSLQRADLRFPQNNQFIGFDNYGSVLGSSLWWADVAHTLFITVISVALELVIGMLVALAMHRVIFARGAVRAIALIPYGIVTVVAAYAWRYAFELDSGWVPKLLGLSSDPLASQGGSYIGVILAEVWKTTPFMALLLLGGLSLVPDELHEAARVDGASTWQRFWRITIPLMKPAILVALLFRTLDAFRIYDTVVIFNNGAHNTETLSVLASNQLLNRLNLGLGSTVSVLLFVMVGIIAFIFIKVFGAAAAPGGGDGR